MDPATAPATAPATLWERLPCCRRVVVRPHARCVSDCGSPAMHRVSYNSGATWLYLCDKHAAELYDKEAT